jgi:hypothetical protein
MNVRYRVELSEVEHDELGVVLSGGRHARQSTCRNSVGLCNLAGYECADDLAGLDLGDVRLTYI